jgi:hypothetical protein
MAHANKNPAVGSGGGYALRGNEGRPKVAYTGASASPLSPIPKANAPQAIGGVSCIATAR